MPSQPKTVETKTTQESKPLPQAMPLLLDVFKRGRDALKQTNNQPFGGEIIAQSGADGAQGLDIMRQAARNGSFAQGTEDFLGMAAKTARGDFLDPATNPFISRVADAATRPLRQTFENTVLPGITDQAITQGAYGGARQDVQQNAAADDLTRAMGDITSNIFYQNYAQERQNQIGSSSMLGQGFDLASAPGQKLLQVDEASRMMQQLGLDNAIQKDQIAKAAPWYGLGEAASLTSTGGFGTQKGSQVAPNPNYTDPFTSLLKGALGTASTIAGLGGGGGFGWWGR